MVRRRQSRAVLISDGVQFNESMQPSGRGYLYSVHNPANHGIHGRSLRQFSIQQFHDI